MKIWSFAGAIIGLLLTLTACLPKVEVPPVDGCDIPELRERKPLPGITWLPQEGNSEFRCLNEGEYEKLKRAFALLRSHEIYLIESYNAVRDRCGGEE